MTVAQLNDRIARIAAAALGAAIVIAVIVVAHPASGHGGVLPAALRFTASPDGAVAVSPAAPKPLLEAPRLRPGDQAAGGLTLRNQTGSRLAVGLRAQPSSTALDGIARVRITAPDGTLFDSTLQALREGTERPLSLAPGAAAGVRLRAWIPAAEATGYEGRSVSVVLEPVEHPAR